MLPAAAVPSFPCSSTIRVVAMLSDSRNRVVSSRMEGKDESSSGRWMYMATSRMTSEKVMLKVSSRSRRKVGSGMTMKPRMHTTAMASEMSLLRVIRVRGSGIDVLCATAMSFLPVQTAPVRFQNRKEDCAFSMPPVGFRSGTRAAVERALRLRCGCVDKQARVPAAGADSPNGLRPPFSPARRIGQAEAQRHDRPSAAGGLQRQFFVGRRSEVQR